MKRCTKCAELKSSSEFRDEPLGKNGKRSICRECDRQYATAFQAHQRLTQPEHVKALKHASYERCKKSIAAKSHERYIAERDKRLEQAAQYRAANRDYILAWHRNHYAANRESRLAQDRRYIHCNKAKVRERQRRYREMHRIEIRLYNRLRKLRLKFSNVEYTSNDWQACLAFWDQRCAICRRPQSDERQICADHWIPLKLGGMTHKLNIIPLCHGLDGCNNKKHDKAPNDWLISMFGEEEAQHKLTLIATYFDSL